MPIGTGPNGDIRLALCGKMKSGKDTACNHLKSLHGGTVIHIFQAGYRWTELLLLYWLVGAKINPDKKTRFERRALQSVGHWGRVLFGKDVWLNKTLKIIAKTKGNVYVTGVRYPNEVERLKEIKVQSVWVERSESDRVLFGATNINHETETALDNFKAFDFIIPNDRDLPTFLRRVESYGHIGKLLEELGEGHINRSARVANMLPAVQESQGFEVFLDGGVERGWQPDEKLDVDTHNCETGCHDHDDLVGPILDDRMAWLTNRQISAEIRRFADIVDRELDVVDPKEAVASVRATLHAIVDNRPLAGFAEDKTQTREEKIALIEKLASEVNAELIKVETADKAAFVRSLVSHGSDLNVLEPSLEVHETLRRAKVERAKRDRYNQARRQRRLEAKVAADTERLSRNRDARMTRRLKKSKESRT